MISLAELEASLASPARKFSVRDISPLRKSWLSSVNEQLNVFKMPRKERQTFVKELSILQAMQDKDVSLSLDELNQLHTKLLKQIKAVAQQRQLGDYSIELIAPRTFLLENEKAKYPHLILPQDFASPNHDFTHVVVANSSLTEASSVALNQYDSWLRTGLSSMLPDDFNQLAEKTEKDESQAMIYTSTPGGVIAISGPAPHGHGDKTLYATTMPSGTRVLVGNRQMGGAREANLVIYPLTKLDPKALDAKGKKSWVTFEPERSADQKIAITGMHWTVMPNLDNTMIDISTERGQQMLTKAWHCSFDLCYEGKGGEKQFARIQLRPRIESKFDSATQQFVVRLGGVTFALEKQQDAWQAPEQVKGYGNPKELVKRQGELATVGSDPLIDFLLQSNSYRVAVTVLHEVVALGKSLNSGCGFFDACEQVREEKTRWESQEHGVRSKRPPASPFTPQGANTKGQNAPRGNGVALLDVPLPALPQDVELSEGSQQGMAALAERFSVIFRQPSPEVIEPLDTPPLPSLPFAPG